MGRSGKGSTTVGWPGWFPRVVTETDTGHEGPERPRGPTGGPLAATDGERRVGRALPRHGHALPTEPAILEFSNSTPLFQLRSSRGQRTPRPRATPSSAPSGDARRAAPRPGAEDRDSSHGRHGCPKHPRAPGQRPPAEQTARTDEQRQHTRQRSPSARPRQAALQQRRCAAAEPQAQQPQAHPRARRRRPQPRPRQSRWRRRYRRHRRA